MMVIQTVRGQLTAIDPEKKTPLFAGGIDGSRLHGLAAGLLSVVSRNAKRAGLWCGTCKPSIASSIC
jgi:hypothetical protein